MAIKNDNTLWVTGVNASGQLGTSDYSSRNTWVQVLTDVKAIAAGSAHSLALKNDGTLWATGLNDKGQLGVYNITPLYPFLDVFTQVFDNVSMELLAVLTVL